MPKDNIPDTPSLLRDASLFRAITDNARDAIFCKDTELRYTFVNPAMARLFGRRAEDLLGRSAEDLFDAEDAAKISEADAPVLQGEETDLVRKLDVDGVCHYFHTVQVPVRDGDGRVQAICGIVRDITQRKHAEQALSESESIVRSFYDNSLLMMGVLELVGDEVEIRSLNAPFADFLGLEPGSAPGTLLSTLSEHPLNQELWGLKLRESERLGLPVKFEQEHQGRWIQTSVSHIAHRDRSRFSCVIDDVTEEKAEEAESEALKEQLRQAQKMDAVGLLAGGVAHDFNNLLTAILGFADVLGEQLAGNTTALSDLEEIRQAGETATALTEQLLAFSRKQSSAPRNIQLNDIISRSERMLRRMIGENLTLTVAPDPDPWKVCMDPAQADQILVNLAANARDAMPHTGTLSFRTSNVRIEDQVCRGCGERFDGDYVLLEIADTGEGMTPTVMERIFDPFFTTKAKGKGTGLGLATVHGIVHQSEGHQEVTSTVGEGTRFQFFLPRSHGDEGPRPDSGQLPRVGGGETVLVAEDQGIVRRLVKRKLEESGYRVVTAEDGEAALRLADTLSEPPELLLTDVVMPRLNGKQLYDRLLERWPSLQVLFMSGYSDHVIAKHGVQSPTFPFLQKPFKAKSLLQKVREALDHPQDRHEPEA